MSYYIAATISNSPPHTALLTYLSFIAILKLWIQYIEESLQHARCAEFSINTYHCNHLQGRITMQIPALFTQKCVFSFEVFPPKRGGTAEQIAPTLATLSSLSPDYISVTLGAAGNHALKQQTLSVAKAIQKDYQTPSVVHLPCINFSEAEIKQFLTDLTSQGIQNVLALRGDYAADGTTAKTDFSYAVDLIRFIRKHFNFSLSAACYPETHLEAKSAHDDLLYLKQKVDTGAEYLISQVFFENQRFYDFTHRAQAIGIQAPIQAGIMPITTLNQAQYIANLTHVHFPASLNQLLKQYATDPRSLRAAGIDYAIAQIQHLQQRGVSGIHLYTMNDAESTEIISKQVMSHSCHVAAKVK